jgi:hypothetical protein
VDDIGGHEDTSGVGFPLMPIFFPLAKRPEEGKLQIEEFPLTQVVSAGLWSLEHMSAIDPSIQYARCLHTDGHKWKLYEVHRTHVKKTKFFSPDPVSRLHNEKLLKYSREPRFFDDYEHMLSVIGMIRYGMGISENIVMKSDSYEVEELSIDPTRTIKQTLLSSTYDRPTLRDRRIVAEIPFDRNEAKQIENKNGEALLE